MSQFSSFLLLYRPVSRLWRAIVVDLVARPKHAARHEIKIPGIGHRVIVVSDGGREDAGLFLPVQIRPRDHVVILPLLVARALFAAGSTTAVLSRALSPTADLAR